MLRPVCPPQAGMPSTGGAVGLGTTYPYQANRGWPSRSGHGQGRRPQRKKVVGAGVAEERAQGGRPRGPKAPPFVPLETDQSA